jgi:CubicO group peptidase (beta-lactamase class C family)
MPSLRTWSSLALVMAVAGPAVAAQAASPEAQAAAFVHAGNTLDEDSIRAWVVAGSRAGVSPDTSVVGDVAARLLQLFSGWRGFRVHSYKTYRHGARVSAVGVIGQSLRTRQWFEIQLGTDSLPPYRVGNTFINDYTAPVELPPGRLGDTAVRRWLSDYLDSLVARDSFSGAVLVARHDTVLLQRAVGFADHAAGRALTLDTPLDMASGGKMFTAVAVTQLVAAGRIHLDDPVSRSLPDYPDTAFARHATVRELLTHTSGLGDYWDSTYEAAWDSITTLAQMLPFVLRHPPDLPPGREFRYSNSGYLLLGLIVERMSGRSYYDYVSRHIFQPARMTHTGYPLVDAVNHTVAREYLDRAAEGPGHDPDRDPGAWIPARHQRRGTSAGGAYSTVGDLLRFEAALSGHRLLDAALTDSLLAGRVPTRPGSDRRYGFGFYRFVLGADIPAYGHGGLAPGLMFEFRVIPRLGYTFVLFQNHDGPALPRVLENLEALALRDTVRVESHTR